MRRPSTLSILGVALCAALPAAASGHGAPNPAGACAHHEHAHGTAAKGKAKSKAKSRNGAAKGRSWSWHRRCGPASDGEGDGSATPPDGGSDGGSGSDAGSGSGGGPDAGSGSGSGSGSDTGSDTGSGSDAGSSGDSGTGSGSGGGAGDGSAGPGTGDGGTGSGATPGDGGLGALGEDVPQGPSAPNQDAAAPDTGVVAPGADKGAGTPSGSTRTPLLRCSAAKGVSVRLASRKARSKRALRTIRVRVVNSGATSLDPFSIEVRVPGRLRPVANGKRLRRQGKRFRMSVGPLAARSSTSAWIRVSYKRARGPARVWATGRGGCDLGRGASKRLVRLKARTRRQV